MPRSSLYPTRGWAYCLMTNHAPLSQPRSAFVAGSFVMPALAACNAGPDKVGKVVRSVWGPIKQRNFNWRRYRIRAPPTETRQYVPKIIAAIIISRNLNKFGF